jgi:hypothetical protein
MSAPAVARRRPASEDERDEGLKIPDHAPTLPSLRLFGGLDGITAGRAGVEGVPLKVLIRPGDAMRESLAVEKAILADLRDVNFDAAPSWDQLAENIVKRHNRSPHVERVVDKMLATTDHLLEQLPADNVQDILGGSMGLKDLVMVSQYIDAIKAAKPDIDFDSLGKRAVEYWWKERGRLNESDDAGAFLVRDIPDGGAGREKAMPRRGEERTMTDRIRDLAVGFLLATSFNIGAVAYGAGHGKPHRHTHEPTPITYKMPLKHQPKKMAEERPKRIAAAEEKAAPKKVADAKPKNPQTADVRVSHSAPSSSHARLARIKADPKNVQNYRLLLSDNQFVFKDQMTVEGIQAFLEKTPYGRRCPLADYRDGAGRNAARIIYDAAKSRDLNPRLIIARLEVEQGLISAKKAAKTKLDWALGAGATDRGRLKGFSGFEKQVSHAADILKRWYDDFDAHSSAHSTVRVNYGKNSITAENAATYALLRYTPHTMDTRLSVIGGGNYLLMDKWDRFGFGD